jgi:hypothetical protein
LTQGVSGVAVLDEEGHLIGSLSIRDLKVLADWVGVSGGIGPAQTLGQIIKIIFTVSNVSQDI